MNEAMGLTAADVAAVTRNDGYDNGFGNGGWWIWIILIAFLFCGNGWGRNNDTATTAGENAFLSDEFVKRDFSIQTRTYLIQLVRHRETY